MYTSTKYYVTYKKIKNHNNWFIIDQNLTFCKVWSVIKLKPPLHSHNFKEYH